MNPTQTAYEACFKKKLYWSEDDAKEAVIRQWSKHGAKLGSYPCHIGRHGTHFHIGHTGEGQQAARAEAIQRLRTFGSQTLLTTK